LSYLQVVNLGTMDLITELENEFAALNESPAPSQVLVITDEAEYQLRMPQLGRDFLAGMEGAVVRVLPLSQALEIKGSYLPIRTDRTLEEFLTRQRTPIRLKLTTSDHSGNCWLLNVQDGWLRVALEKGLSWVPIGSIRSLEIVPVDNSNH
jgi:hypothetical protein